MTPQITPFCILNSLQFKNKSVKGVSFEGNILWNKVVMICYRILSGHGKPENSTHFSESQGKPGKVREKTKS